jgi:hypothetical protein
MGLNVEIDVEVEVETLLEIEDDAGEMSGHAENENDDTFTMLQGVQAGLDGPEMTKDATLDWKRKQRGFSVFVCSNNPHEYRLHVIYGKHKLRMLWCIMIIRCMGGLGISQLASNSNQATSSSFKSCGSSQV